MRTWWYRSVIFSECVSVFVSAVLFPRCYGRSVSGLPDFTSSSCRGYFERAVYIQTWSSISTITQPLSSFDNLCFSLITYFHSFNCTHCRNHADTVRHCLTMEYILRNMAPRDFVIAWPSECSLTQTNIAMVSLSSTARWDQQCTPVLWTQSCGVWHSRDATFLPLLLPLTHGCLGMCWQRFGDRTVFCNPQVAAYHSLNKVQAQPGFLSSSAF